MRGSFNFNLTNAGFADLFTVFAKVDGVQFTGFLVERTFPGVSLGHEERKLGIHGSSTRALHLADAQVPVENVLGEIGRGHVIAFNILNVGRAKLGANTMGNAKYVLKLAAAYALKREQFGRPIARFGAVRQKLAEMAVRIFAAETIVYRTAGLIDEALATSTRAGQAGGRALREAVEEYAIECSILKVACSEALDYVVDEAVQIHGGYGFSREYPVERFYRDSRINRIFEGTNEINRLVIPGLLLKRAARRGLAVFQAGDPNLPHAAPANGDGLLGEAARRYGDGLQEEQEVLLLLSDLVMDAYCAESVLLRARKVLASRSPASGPTVAAMARVFAQDALDRAVPRIRTLATTMGARGTNGHDGPEQASDEGRVDTIALRRSIADAVTHHRGYCV